MAIIAAGISAGASLVGGYFSSKSSSRDRASRGTRRRAMNLMNLFGGGQGFIPGRVSSIFGTVTGDGQGMNFSASGYTNQFMNNLFGLETNVNTLQSQIQQAFAPQEEQLLQQFRNDLYSSGSRGVSYGGTNPLTNQYVNDASGRSQQQFLTANQIAGQNVALQGQGMGLVQGIIDNMMSQSMAFGVNRFNAAVEGTNTVLFGGGRGVPGAQANTQNLGNAIAAAGATLAQGYYNQQQQRAQEINNQANYYGGMLSGPGSSSYEEFGDDAGI